MFGLDHSSALAWLTAAGLALAGAWDRWDRRTQRRADESAAKQAVASLTEAVAAKNAELVQLRAEITSLRTENSSLRDRIDHLETLLEARRRRR